MLLEFEFYIIFGEIYVWHGLLYRAENPIKPTLFCLRLLAVHNPCVPFRFCCLQKTPLRRIVHKDGVTLEH